MNRERLLKLADYMERVDQANYYQSVWASWKSQDSISVVETDRGTKALITEGACGTTRCVLGHAVDAVPEAGLWFCYKSQSWVYIVCQNPETNYLHYNYEAAAYAFDIPEEHAEVIFGADHDAAPCVFYAGRDLPRGDFHAMVTPTIVAQKLRQYVETDGASIEAALDAVTREPVEDCDEQ